MEVVCETSKEAIVPNRGQPRYSQALVEDQVGVQPERVLDFGRYGTIIFQLEDDLL